MAAGTTPIFVLTPKCPSVRISTANTNRDGATGTYGTLYTAGSNGAFFKGIRVQAEGTTTAGVVRIFRQAGGTGNVELLKEMLILAVTPSASVEAASAEWFPSAGIVLDASGVLKVSTHNAETFGVHAEAGGDY
jgi:hypothetical protein